MTVKGQEEVLMIMETDATKEKMLDGTMKEDALIMMAGNQCLTQNWGFNNENHLPNNNTYDFIDCMHK